MTEDLHAEFIRQMDEDWTAGQDAREAAESVLRFMYAPGGHWDGFMDDETRTKLQFDVSSEQVDRFVGEWGLNQVGVNFEPDEGEVSEDDAELLQGLYRRDWRSGNGEVAVDQAVTEAAVCGYGAFLLSTEFEDEEDPENDKQRTSYEALYSACTTTVWDSGSQAIDRSDARRVVVLARYSVDGFKQAYPDQELPSGVEPRTDYQPTFKWHKAREVFVAKRYDLKSRTYNAIIYGNPANGQIKSVPKKDASKIEDELLADGFIILRERKIRERYIERSVFDGIRFIEEPRRIAGRALPVIPVYAKRAFVDGRETYRGMVRDKKDAQRLFDLLVSNMADAATSSNRDIPMLSPEQIEGYEGIWGSDWSKLPYLPLEPLRDAEGEITIPGAQGFMPARQVDPNTAVLMQAIIGFMDRSGGNYAEVNDPNASGVALIEAQKRLDLSTAHYMNKIKLGIKRGGEVWRELVKDTYKEPRSVKVVSESGTKEFVQLFEQVMDEQTGQMIEVNDLTRGKFEVVVDTGPQYESKRQEAVDALADRIDKLQGTPYHAPALAMWFELSDFPNDKPLKKIARRQLLEQGLTEPENEEEEQYVEAISQPQDGPSELEQAITAEQATKAGVNQSQIEKNLSQAELNKAKAQDIAPSRVDNRIKMLTNAA